MIGFGQNVNIPDTNFKAYLVGEPSINTNGDSEIQVSEANSFNGSINCTNMNIADLTGIEYFTDLITLYCSNNQLTTIDLSQNTALDYFACDENQFTTIDVSQNTSLTSLICNYNQLTSLNLSGATALTTLHCGWNQLTNLDVSQNIALTTLGCLYNQLTTLDVSNNTSLDVLNCAENQLTSLDVTNNWNLTQFSCPYNQLTSLDVTNNWNLTGFSCHYNQLNNLDVSQNIALTTLACNYNQLTTLDVSSNTSLDLLNCADNQLTSLDVSNNTALWRLECNNNQLTSFDVSNNTSLTYLWCWINQLTSLDLSNNTALIELKCQSNQLTSLDLSQNSALTSLDCQSNQLTTLDVSNNFNLTYLGCSNNQLISLDVSNNLALTSLNCQGNQLTSLDVSNNLALTGLGCAENQLTSLYLSQNTTLTSLYCFSNQLTSLDLSQNTALTSLYCFSNQLTSLDLRNGNNLGLLQLQFSSQLNPDLYCIDVDNVAWADANWTVANSSIDSTMSFSTNCAISLGCTDSLALNYDLLATIDDSSCVYCDLSIDSLGVTQMTCFTWNNASVNIIATGTQPLPYNYYVVRLNPTDTVFQGNLSFYNGLGAGTFVAMVEDNVGCIDSDTFTINSTDSVYIDSVIYSNVSCNGMANGYISAIIPMGGTPPYQFSLNGGPLYPSCLCVVSPSCPTGYVFSGLSPGTYTVEIWDSNMCANSYQIFITEPPLIIWQQAFSICDGDSVLVGSSVYHTNGNYIDTLTAGSGCDSIVYTNISIAFPTIWYQTYLICDGDNIAVGNNVYDTAGVYIDTLSSANGCDSIIQTYLMVEQNTYSYDTLVIGASIVWNGIPLNVSGDYSVTLINSTGCDSIANLNLTITNTTGLLDVTNTEKTLLKITDMLGQETPYRRNTPLFYIYDDGTVEKRIVIE
jgi:Leucine-rich repeat (LRR) protein